MMLRSLPAGRIVPSIKTLHTRLYTLHPLQALHSHSVHTHAQAPKLDLPALDRKWQTIWKERNATSTGRKDWTQRNGNGDDTDRKQKYILSMFPYPSGTLHMGHLRVYTISDVLARFYGMNGHDVLHPMGWDAFGLPAENAALERGVDPAVWTRDNIQRMKEQLTSFSGRFDWNCEVTTCSPEFYEHTQRIFLMLYRRGLAYRDEAVVNYDPVDGTVLANEQVDARGYSWRSGSRIQKVKLKQWFFRITAYKEALLNDLETLTNGWPERVLSMQRNWLGRSDGAKVKFPVSVGGADHQQHATELELSVFTTRPDTLYGVEYLALALDHPIARQAAEKDKKLRAFIEEAQSLPADSKAGYKLCDVWASHPLHLIDSSSSHAARKLPVYVAPYVLGDYGEGAVMGVPGHDARDLAFFKENSNTEFSIVVRPEKEPVQSDNAAAVDETKAFTNEGYLTAECGKYQGLHSREASQQIIADLQKVGHGERVEQWRLRDWLISRQRYWGTPIPIIHCDDCGAVPVPDDQLPVQLPTHHDASHHHQGKGNRLESGEWKHVACPSCGQPATRDTDTMDTFVDSSWYFLRFLDAHNPKQPFSPDRARPVDMYIGGIEHAILHLLYARFIYKFLANELKLELPGSSAAEPFRTLLSQGMVHGKTFSDPETGKFQMPDEVNERSVVSFEKMSKSKYNGVDPTACTQRFGADATRAHVLFAAPVSEVLDWDESKIVGIERWYGRVWKAVHAASQGEGTVSGGVLPASSELSDEEAEMVLATHNTITSVTQCLETNPYALNTVVSDLTKLTNTLAGGQTVRQDVLRVCVSSLVHMLAPIAPALASECWSVLDPEGDVFAEWPAPLLRSDEAEALSKRGGQTVAVQINGKLRFTVRIPRSSDAGTEWVVDGVLATAEGKDWLQTRHDWEKRRRVVVVGGGKLMNVVF